ncbi:hypothetical protein WICPIJ_007874 [Wickerhamomyces pijperi]|uniref:F-box/LRR-repeat protein 15-like leucin rich repeat domain-containing protein n=1 Tax=Wickerhamomyces pijperi TaxID=599730 RepID=A0A9P8Q1S9_WICPI|nr:hypothetical protein WICPIJ_007874 [Wickerhamomyces pijperi]
MSQNPYKRTRDSLASPDRPSKRSNSPTRIATGQPSTFKTPPSTPRKKSPSRQSLITKFDNIFKNKSAVHLPYVSPISPHNISSLSDDSEESETEYSSFPITQQEQDTYPLTPDCSFVSLPSFEEEEAHHQIFDIPEILREIITHLDNDHTTYPCEQPPLRRRPTSFEHALLICGNQYEEASKLWRETSDTVIDYNPKKNTIFNCLVVNKLWYSVTKSILTKKLFFSEESKWKHFVHQTNKESLDSSHGPLHRSVSNTNLFILHKSKFVHQSELDQVAPQISGPSLQHLELYICPQVIPPLQLFTFKNLRNLILPGSKFLNDSNLSQISKFCPLLTSLDLRQCPLISDKSIYHVSKNCQLLNTLNLSRFTNSTLITDKSLYFITKYLRNIDTLGFAGCSITDRGICKLALYRSNTLKRLSLNNCPLLTDSSIPLLLKQGYFYNIVVLEIRYNEKITDLRPLVEYQDKQLNNEGVKVLIECCEVLQKRFNLAVSDYQTDKLKRLRFGLSHWVSGKHDEDQ